MYDHYASVNIVKKLWANTITACTVIAGSHAKLFTDCSWSTTPAAVSANDVHCSTLVEAIFRYHGQTRRLLCHRRGFSRSWTPQRELTISNRHLMDGGRSVGWRCSEPVGARVRLLGSGDQPVSKCRPHTAKTRLQLYSVSIECQCTC